MVVEENEMADSVANEGTVFMQPCEEYRRKCEEMKKKNLCDESRYKLRDSSDGSTWRLLKIRRQSYSMKRYDVQVYNMRWKADEPASVL